MKYITTNKYVISRNGKTFFNKEYTTKSKAIHDIHLQYGEGYVGRLYKIKITKNDIEVDSIIQSLLHTILCKDDIILVDRVPSPNDYKQLSSDLQEYIVNYLNEHNYQPMEAYVIHDIEKVTKPKYTYIYKEELIWRIEEMIIELGIDNSIKQQLFDKIKNIIETTHHVAIMSKEE